MANRSPSLFFSENKQFHKGSPTTQDSFVPTISVTAVRLGNLRRRSVGWEGQLKSGLWQYKRRRVKSHYLQDRCISAVGLQAEGGKSQIFWLIKWNPHLPKYVLIISYIQTVTLDIFLLLTSHSRYELSVYHINSFAKKLQSVLKCIKEDYYECFCKNLICTWWNSIWRLFAKDYMPKWIQYLSSKLVMSMWNHCIVLAHNKYFLDDWTDWG